jgi:hypothetical protein
MKRTTRQIEEKVLKAYLEDKEVLNNTAQALILTALADLNGQDEIAKHHAKKFLDRADNSELSLERCCKILNIDKGFIKNKISYLSKLF